MMAEGHTPAFVPGTKHAQDRRFALDSINHDPGGYICKSHLAMGSPALGATSAMTVWHCVHGSNHKTDRDGSEVRYALTNKVQGSVSAAARYAGTGRFEDNLERRR